MPLPSFIKSRAFAYSAALHLVVITILIIGIEPSKKIAPAGPTKPLIEAKAVNLAAIEAEKKRKADLLAKQKQAELDKRKAEQKKREEADEKQKREEARKAQEKKRAELEAKRRADDEKKAREKQRKEAEAKRQAEQEKIAAEKKRQEALKRKKEAEELAAKKKAAEEKRRQQALEEALAAEERELAAAQQQAADDSEIAKYTRAIASQVTQAFRYPPGLEEGMVCTLYVRMIPGGEVIEARVIESSGSPTFDRQAENAVRKAAPLPVPDEPRLFGKMRELRFVFDPSN
ncbi:MAG: cell envelope integrity protein TolA [Gammaproteobacteria bacterium]